MQEIAASGKALLAMTLPAPHCHCERVFLSPSLRANAVSVAISYLEHIKLLYFLMQEIAASGKALLAMTLPAPHCHCEERTQ